MIRLPPTAITLAPADLRDFYRRRWDSEAVAIQYGFTNAQLAQDDPSDHRWYNSHLGSLASKKQSDEKQRRIMGIGPQGDGTMAMPSDNEPTDSRSRRSQLESRLAPYRSRETTSITHSEISEDDTDYNDLIHSRDIPSALSSSGSDENTDYQAIAQSTSMRDDFHYGGFTETPRARKSDQQDEGDEITPHIQLPEHQRPGGRATLPRSPLFISQNASSSPDNSRVASNVRQESTPGTLFSRPARRTPGIRFGSFSQTPRRLPRVFRHQTNSFSLDSNERASAVYEQDRVSSTSSSDSGPLSNMRSLGEELRNSSLGSSRVPSIMSAGTSSSENEQNEAIDSSHFETLLPHGRRLYSSSPSLTPTHASQLISVGKSHHGSTVISNATAAAEGSDNDKFIPPAAERSQRRYDSGSRISTVHRHAAQSSNSASYSGTSSSRRSHGIFNLPRDRPAADHRRSPDHPSPSPPTSPSLSPSSTVQPSSPSRVSRTTTPQPRTPSSVYRVYNDSLPPTSQPQTPAHLAEARHQSRFHPSYTAPVFRHRERLGTTAPGQGVRSGRGIPFNMVTIDRSRSRTTSQAQTRHGGRSNSPTGLVTEGFQGLYGGRENGDDEANYIEGVQFDGAPRRLWDGRET